MEPGQVLDETPSIDKIEQLLKAKDDTSRFVGLALLKSVLDNSPQLQNDQGAVTSLWNCISPKFLDRLLRDGSRPGSNRENSKEMVDLAVAVIHTFTVLLPDDARQDTRLLGRIPRLTQAVLYSSKETVQVIIQTLVTLVSTSEGAHIFAHLDADDWTPLIEIAPEYAHVLTIFIWSWEKGTAGLDTQESKGLMRGKIDKAIQSFVSSFIGTDATSLLEFVAHVLRNLDADLITLSPKWLEALTRLIRNLSTNRPTSAARYAYTNCAGTLLLLYPDVMPKLLFSDERDSGQPFSYLFINLILIDLKATLPSLLEKLNDPEYPRISLRLTSSLDILTAFISQLIAYMEELDSPEAPLDKQSPSMKMSPDLLLKLSKSIAETLSVVMEYLRDRWDASVAGAQGLHQKARSGVAHTSSGSHKTLAWDARDESAATDSFTLSAIRALALWLRDDDGDMLRKEGAGLMDMFMELYQNSSTPSSSSFTNNIDFRLPILAALEGILQTSNGIEAFHANEGWKVITRDLVGILDGTSSASGHHDADAILRGSRICLVLLQVITESSSERSGGGSTSEEHMDLVTAVAAYDPTATIAGQEEGAQEKEAAVLDFQVDVLHVASKLLENANPGMRRRYAHSAAAICDIAEQVMKKSKMAASQEDIVGDLEGVLGTLAQVTV
ncbi:DUF1941-domain-containing protein [Xylariomycetidae sp. FL2044]|nr:DUF1941-domain-containing protein [Xylariomycetidae sp. FL2044]